jgi:phospholipid/cholesterol/gamma-HCH transport system substrate-binding protein
MRRLAVLGFGAAALVAVLAIVLSGGGSPYVIRVQLADAAGLQSRSPVMIGGVPAGTISLHLGRNDQVIAQLQLDRSQAPVGKDASVAIAAVNFLGQKEAEITRGNVADPAPSGYLIPASHVTVATDLDQVLDVLDPSTRARLAILIDETGSALTGRRADFSELMGELPHSLVDANALLSRMVSDNHTLADLVTSSDQFVTQVTSQRAQLSRMIGAVGQAAVTVVARRAQLAQTLGRAPATLSTLQRFLDKLKATTVPLGPAAANVVKTAPSLSATLAQVVPFQHAAGPALTSARAVAPELVTLADRATPVVVQANPVVSSLATFAGALGPVSQILNHSADNLLAVVDNWSRAIQFRDGLSHVFRGEGGVTPDVLISVIERLLGKSSAHARHGSPAHQGAPRVHQPAAVPSAPGLKLPAPVSVPGLLKRLGAAAGAAVPGRPPPALRSLLGYLVRP